VEKDDLAALFRAEGAHRADGSPRVDDVVAAFSSAGVPVLGLRQHLAKPFGATYCAGAEAAEGVVLSLCEYASAEAAVKGRSDSAKSLATIPNRQVMQNGTTTLTLRERERTSRSQVVVSTLRHAFENLRK
jgi:hypothetical protein